MELYCSAGRFRTAPKSIHLWQFGDLTDHALNPLYYQGNRDPFTDHPEWVWSVFMNQTNDSQIAISGASIDGNGGSTKNVDLGRVFVGDNVPAAQSVTLNKAWP